MDLRKIFNRRPQSLSGTALRDALLGAAARKDYATFGALYKAHEQRIREEFCTWLSCPPGIATDQAAIQQYVEGLSFVARVFQQAGDEALMNALMRPGDNPIEEWKRNRETAKRLLDEGRAAEAAALLERTLALVQKGFGSAVDDFRPRLLGDLGIVRWRLGDQAGGAEATRRALAMCEAAGDAEGVRTYASNLEVVERRPSVVLREPRPGRGAEGAEGTRVPYEVQVDNDVPTEADALHQEGRAQGAAGRYTEALLTFTRASALAPYWPYPLYDRAFTHLLMENWDAALADYLHTVALAPRGFFMALTAADTLQREAAGEFPRGLFLDYARLELITDAGDRRRIVEPWVTRDPGFAPGWLEWGKLFKDSQERLDAFDRGLSAYPDPETKGMLQLNKVFALLMTDREAATTLLRTLIDDPSSTTATEALARHSLTRLENGLDPFG